MPKAKLESKNYVNAFADAMAAFSTDRKEGISRVAETLVVSFDADAAELWLWDETSGSGYLTHSFGCNGRRRLDYAVAGSGVIGKIASSRKTIENIVLSTCGPDDHDFSHQTGLSHIAGYPLRAQDSLMGVLAVYTRGEAPEELLTWWRLYADVSEARLSSELAAQEKDKQITQLSLLFEATRLLNSTLDLAELLELILRIARTEVKADRASVFLVDHKRKELWSIVASGLGQEEIRIPLGTGVAGRVASSGEIINVEDAYMLDFFDSSFDRKFQYKTGSILCVPIRHHSGSIVGVVELLNSQSGRFSQQDADFLSRLSGHMAMALENARLHRDSLEKQRHERDLILARSIQRGLLPEQPPVVPGYDIAVLNDPCFEIGGDYYDFVQLGPQSLLVVVADVEGKGVTSALMASTLKATLRALVMHLHSLEVVAFSLNEMLYNESGSGRYLSLFLGLVDTRRNVLQYINAGHVPPILVRAGAGEVKLLEEGGTVIGLFPDADYRRGSVKLDAGDVLVCSTDGILEISDEHGHEYGIARLAEFVRRQREKSAQGIVDAVLSEVAGYSTASVSADDKVLVVMKVTNSAAN